ncbi:MAG TPA: enoyl-CoA hydratase/isomerase family protein [Terrimesophilobacter sp.]|uniref:enoyl-CoA hydratase/isomerase family protein n=1 Tax=Terrimesophilobacter sp. TaxID=2906435 RepID=UPI002F91F896
MESPEEPVLVERRGRLGHIVLNRPRAMNALTRDMVNTIAGILDDWESDDGVATVLVSGAGDRGLCAGGDIVSMYRDALAGGVETAQFWADEYALNARIARYPKPYLAFMDGVVLGGGIGVSAHGAFRVVTERTRFGMPEVGIGFVPDVGGSYLLSRAPGELGTHLAMTGGMGSGSDAIALGFADHFVPSDRLAELAASLESVSAEQAIAGFATEAPPSTLLAQRPWIDECYSGDRAREIVSRLQASGVPEAEEAASVILTKSPTSVSVALESVRRARGLGTLEEVLDQEYRVSLRFIEGAEIVEGIRAQVIDKDRKPRWSPATLAEVTTADVDHYFKSLGPRELGLSNSGTSEQE